MDRGLTRRNLMIATSALTLFPWPLLAQPWRPSQPVRIIVAAAPGGTLDIHARAAQPVLSSHLNQALIVENQGGGAGLVATQTVARSAPDGLTQMVASGDGLILQDILVGARHGRPASKLRPVTMTITAAQLLCTHPRSGIRNIDDYLLALRTRGDKVTLAVPGIGGIAHIISEMVNRALGLTVTHVPYRGGGPATIDLLAGQVDAQIITLPAVTTYVREGRLIPLAVSTLQRDPAMPNVPTFAESGIPGFDVPSTQGILVPLETPDHIVDVWYRAWKVALDDPGVKQRLQALGFVIHASTPAQFDKVLKDAEKRFAEVIAAAGIKGE
jgi:tripartite-type tricarboxylate transporter receptor subunit TctC